MAAYTPFLALIFVFILSLKYYFSLLILINNLNIEEKCKRRFILSNGVAKYDNPPVSGEYDDNQFIPVEVPKGILLFI